MATKRHPSVSRLSANIAATYERATAGEKLAGRNWYQTVHDIAREMDPANPARAAGVIAALSPQAGWTLNLKWARESVASGTAVGNTGANRAKAQRILNGEDPDDVLGGDKVRAFYVNILHPDIGDGVTVDRHAFDIANGRRGNDQTRARLALKGCYQRYADAYRHAATELNVTPAGLQAATWVAWRQTHGIIR